MKNPKLIGVLCIVLPVVLLAVTIAAHAILRFVFASVAMNASDPAIAIGSVVNTIFGFIGVLGTIGVVVGWPLGIYFLVKEEPMTGPHDPRSGKHEQSEFPPELAGWSWGGFALTWIWGVGNSVWFSLLAFLPFGNIIMPFVLGVKGKEWAWAARRWTSIEEFKKTQKVWDIIGIILFCGLLAFLLLMVFAVMMRTR